MFSQASSAPVKPFPNQAVGYLHLNWFSLIIAISQVSWSFHFPPNLGWKLHVSSLSPTVRCGHVFSSRTPDHLGRSPRSQTSSKGFSQEEVEVGEGLEDSGAQALSYCSSYPTVSHTDARARVRAHTGSQADGTDWGQRSF